MEKSINFSIPRKRFYICVNFFFSRVAPTNKVFKRRQTRRGNFYGCKAFRQGNCAKAEHLIRQRIYEAFFFENTCNSRPELIKYLRRCTYTNGWVSICHIWPAIDLKRANLSNVCASWERLMLRRRRRLSRTYAARRWLKLDLWQHVVHTSHALSTRKLQIEHEPYGKSEIQLFALKGVLIARRKFLDSCHRFRDDD